MSDLADDNLEFNCPQCKTQIKVPPSQAGERTQCPRCASPIFVPGMQNDADDFFDDLFEDDVQPVPAAPEKKTVERTTERTTEKSTPPTEPEPIPLTSELVAPDPTDSLENELKVDDEVLSFDDDTSEPVTTQVESSDPLAFLDDVSESLEKVVEPSTDSAVDLLGDILTPDENPLSDDLLLGTVNVGLDSPPEISAPDPFEAPDDEPIKIDGIDGTYGTEMISILCPVCDSRVYGKRRAQKYQIKCEDCFSMVDIPGSEEWDSENKDSAPKRQTGTDMVVSIEEPGADDLKLEEPVTKPTIDYDVEDDFGLEPVSSDLLAPKVHPIESELFHRNEPELTLEDPALIQSPAPPQDPTPATGTASPISLDQDDLLLEPLDADDLGPPISSDSVEPALLEPNDDDQLELLPLQEPDLPLSPEIPVTPQTPAAPAYPHAETPAPQPVVSPGVPDASGAGGNQAPQSPETPESKPLPGNLEQTKKSEDRPVGDMIVDWFKAPLFLFKSPEALAQLGFFFILQAIGLILVGIGSAYLQPDPETTSDAKTVGQMVAYFPYFFGKFICLCAWLYQGVILYNCILLGLYQDEEAAEWPELQIEEIFSQFWRVGLANIAAGMPLVLLMMVMFPLGVLGIAIAMVLGTLIWFLLGPPMMMSALYNQEFYKIFSPKIFQSYKTVSKPWMIFYGFMFFLWFFYLGTTLLTITNSCFANTFAALIWTVVTAVQGGLIGYQFRQIMLATGDVSRITPTDKEQLAL